MRVVSYKYPDSINTDRPSVVALGFFDGVHLGHKSVIQSAVRLAAERGLLPAVLTFSSEASDIKPGATRLYSTEDRLRLIAELGVELAVVVDFASVRELSQEDFVHRVLVGELNCKIAVVGEDFRFGAGATGDSGELSRLMSMEAGGACIHKMQQHTFKDGRTVNISSSAIRDYLSAGDVGSAAALLGAPYFIRGTVVRGRGDGHNLGFPTVNTELSDGLPLARGVYETRVRLGDATYPALTNLGTCPTLGERRLHAETHILGFSGDIYGEKIQIEFIDFIREEMDFADEDTLVCEVEKNIRDIKEKRGI